MISLFLFVVEQQAFVLLICASMGASPRLMVGRLMFMPIFSGMVQFLVISTKMVFPLDIYLRMANFLTSQPGIFLIDIPYQMVVKET